MSVLRKYSFIKENPLYQKQCINQRIIFDLVRIEKLIKEIFWLKTQQKHQYPITNMSFVSFPP